MQINPRSIFSILPLLGSPSEQAGSHQNARRTPKTQEIENTLTLKSYLTFLKNTSANNDAVLKKVQPDFRTDPGSGKLILDGPILFTIEYSGAITETIAGVNLISSDVIELALYAAFHPFNLDREINWYKKPALLFYVAETGDFADLV